MRYETRPCPRCRSRDSRVRWTQEDRELDYGALFQVSVCSSCGLLFQNPMVRPDELGRYYSAGYAPYSLEKLRISDAAIRHLKLYKGYTHLPEPVPISPLRRPFAKWSAGAQMLPDYLPEGSLLEIGCAAGQRLQLLRELGWESCTGIEYNSQAAERCRELGFDVRTGAVESEIRGIPDYSQHVVIAGAVLEHLADPFSLVREIARKLRPLGQFIFSTVVIDSLDFRIFGKYWYNLDLPRHLVFFRKEDLKYMLRDDFTLEGIYGQYSTNDYVKSAGLRLRDENRRLDRWIVSAGERLRYPCQLLALLGMTSRVAVHARKK